MTDGKAIDARIAELEIEREEIEFAMADIRAQLDVNHLDKGWRAKAKAALRYRGVDHQAVLREIGALKREQKAPNPGAEGFPRRFTDLAKAMLPTETFNAIRDAALAAIAGSPDPRDDGEK